MNDAKTIARLRETVTFMDEASGFQNTLIRQLQAKVEGLLKMLEAEQAANKNLSIIALANRAGNTQFEWVPLDRVLEAEETIRLLTEELRDLEKHNTDLERELEDRVYLDNIQNGGK